MEVFSQKMQVIVCLLFFSLFSSLLNAQDFTIKVDHYNIEDGLSHRQVNTIHQDQNGFIWLGTQYGLNRFDGYEFKWWTVEVNGLSSNRIVDILEDAEGYLWLIDKVSNTGGSYEHILSVDLLHPETGELWSLEEKLSDTIPLRIGDLFSDDRVKGSDGTLYFGTKEQARLVSYHPQNSFKIYPIKGFQSFYPFACSENQTIWGIGNQNTVLEIDTAGNILHQYEHKKGSITPNEIFYNPPDVYYQLRIDPKTLEFQKFKIDREKKRTEINNIIPDLPTLIDPVTYNLYNGFRFLPQNQGIWAFRPPYHTVYYDENRHFNLASYINIKNEDRLGVKKVLTDTRGRMWMTSDFGLYCLTVNDQVFHQYAHGRGKDIACRDILKIGDTLVIGTERDLLIILNEKNEKRISSPLGTIRDIANYSLCQDEGHKIWVGTRNLDLIDIASNEILESPKNGSKTDMIWAIHKDKNNRIWLGRQLGLDYYEPGEDQLKSFEGFNGFMELANSTIIDFIPKNDDTVWLCTNKGIFELDIRQGITARYWTGGINEFHLPNDDIRHIYIDFNGIIWLATGGGGLVRWAKEQGELKQYTRAHGLANNFIYAIYADDYNNLWMSSDYGIIRFNKETEQFKSYSIEDGITHNEFNRISHFQDDNGRIYFGSLNGVTAFHPGDFYRQDAPNTFIPLRITKFEQFDGQKNQIVDRTTNILKNHTITLKPDDRFFRLEFALLSYNAPDQIRYAYKVEGVDRDWSYQKERSLRMSQLPYGEHILKIKGQAANGQWSQQELSISIDVLKPFYLQFWFIALTGCLLSVIAYRMYRFHFLRQMEKREARQLQEINALKSRFFTNITHEFRTPLTVILGMTEERTDVPKAMNLIRRNGQKLLNLVNQLLDISRIDTGNLPVNYQLIEIVSFTHYLGESFQSLAEKKHIRLTIYSEVDELWLDMDEEKYRQIIGNLLSNAVKFTPESGKVILHLSQRNERLVLYVKDNGIGIPKAELSHIFDRFYQVDNPASREGKGTGIGLALTKELTELLEGEIRVKSKEGKGTTFELGFPIRNTAGKRTENYAPEITDQALSASPIIADDPVNEEQPLLLVIEDNPDILQYIQSLLGRQYALHFAKNGAEGIQKAITEIPDIIISDVMMPEKDGFEVVRTLKKDERTSHIPIILLTAKATHMDRIEGLRWGADAYLKKPFDKTELMIRLKKLVELRQQLREKYAGYLPANVKPVNPDERFLQKLHQLVQQHLSEADFTVEQLTRSMGMSHTQLYRKLKALNGQTPSQYMRHIRLQAAKHLLTNSQLNISEIAYEVGFTDPNYFNRLFSKEFGAPPSEFRK